MDALESVISDSSSSGCVDDELESTSGLVSRVSEHLEDVQAVADGCIMTVRMMPAMVGEMSARLSELGATLRDAGVTADQTSARVESTAADVGELSRLASDIQVLSRSIDHIAGQITILALNATIEAARAGEAGRGFAVVAGEVKTLARETVGAAERIEDRLSSIAVVSERVVASMNAAQTDVGDLRRVLADVGDGVERQCQVSTSVEAFAHQGAGSIDEIGGALQRVRDDLVALETFDSSDREGDQNATDGME